MRSGTEASAAVSHKHDPTVDGDPCENPIYVGVPVGSAGEVEARHLGYHDILALVPHHLSHPVPAGRSH